jgi:hypothetical protein
MDKIWCWVSVRYFAAPCLPFCVDGVEEWSIKKSEHKCRVLFDVHRSPPAARVCVFSSGFFSLLLPSGAAVFSIVSFRGFHCAGCRKTHNLHYTLYCPLQVFDTTLSPKSPNQICWAQLKWVSWCCITIGQCVSKCIDDWRYKKKKHKNGGFDQLIFGVFVFFKEAIQM